LQDKYIQFQQLTNKTTINEPVAIHLVDVLTLLPLSFFQSVGRADVAGHWSVLTALMRNHGWFGVYAAWTLVPSIR
jgi:hypothetical protein